LIDTSVLVALERRTATASLDAWQAYSPAFISAMTCSELLVGVHRADTPERRNQRGAFVEALLARMTILDVDLEVARVHAQVRAQMPRGVVVDAHDLLIGATALRHGIPVLTGNVQDFARIPGLHVLPFA
jgi:predicted nucleic acid-binding protein